MYKCLDCGHLFEESKKVKEKMGEFWGLPAYETFHRCPKCEGDFEEAVQCEKCGKWFFDDELIEGHCEDCVDDLRNEYKGNAQKCYDLTTDCITSMNINTFLASCFTESQIEEILLKELKDVFGADFSDFINQDIEWFVEITKKGGGMNEEMQKRQRKC